MRAHENKRALVLARARESQRVRVGVNVEVMEAGGGAKMTAVKHRHGLC